MGISRNCSPSAASLLSVCSESRKVSEEFILSECFPQHVRTLRRRISDTLQASSEFIRSGTDGGAARPRAPCPSLAEAAAPPLRPSIGSSAGATGGDDAVERHAGEDAASCVSDASTRGVRRRSMGFEDAPASPEPTGDAAEFDAAEARANASAGDLLASLATPALLRGAASSGDVNSVAPASPG